MSCPKVWNIEKEKDKEKEKGGDRPSKLNDKKHDRELEREMKTKETIFLEKECDNFAPEKMRNASGHQGENER